MATNAVVGPPCRSAATVRSGGRHRRRRVEAGVVDVVVGDEPHGVDVDACPRAPPRPPSASSRSGGQRCGRGRTRCWSRPAAGSTLPGEHSASTSARRRARAWSSARRSTMVSSATTPAAAITPAWRIPPAEAGPVGRAPRRSTRAVPQSSEPTGALNPFERQNIMVSVPAGEVARRDTERDRRRSRSARRRSARRARASRATAATASISATLPGPPARRHVRVLDEQRAEIAGRWCCCDADRVLRRRRARSTPSASGSGRSCTPRVDRGGRVLVAVDVGRVRRTAPRSPDGRAAAAPAGWPSCPTARRARPPCRAARPPATRAGARSGPRRTRRRPPRRRPSLAASPASAW